MRPPRSALTLFAALTIGVGMAVAPAPSRADNALDCYAENLDLRIRGCTALLDQGTLTPLERATVLASRALALSMKTWYREAIQDYDRSLTLAPNQPIALNNRAWAYFRWGQPAAGVEDVEKSLRLDPSSGAAYDTRAHIRQALGHPQQALTDYRLAMTFGGERMIKMYQCGLSHQGLYKGPMDGVSNSELDAALSQCTLDTICDPLPADEECRTGTS